LQTQTRKKRRRGWFVLIVLCLWGQLGINIYIDHQLTDLKDAYARDTTLAYNAGVRHGIEQAVDSSPDVEALATLFSRYRHADAPNFARWVVYYSAKYRVPQVILAGMVLQESSGNPDARSSCGAVGLTQIRWRYWGETLKDAGICEKESDLLEPETSIEAGAYILRTLIDTHGDIDGALRHYSGNAKNYTDKVIGRVWG
jgi:soluble lytic murein transglycosylase-like protein